MAPRESVVQPSVSAVLPRPTTKIEVSNLTPYQSKWVRGVGVFLGAVMHTIIAVVTYLHCRDAFAGDDNRDSQSSAQFDFMANILYFTVIDAVLSVLQLNRGGVRIWHWKLNFVIMSSAILLFYSKRYLVNSAIMIGVMIWVYNRIRNDPLTKAVFAVGLDKYMTGCNEDYFDVSWIRNRKYLVITLVELVLVWKKMVWFFSPLLFVFADAVHNRLTKLPRTKISDFYVSVITAAMDTGLWMSLFNFPADTTMPWTVDIGSLLFYLALVEVLVRVNDALVKECYRVINGPRRYVCMVLFILATRAVGSGKHAFAVCGFNLLANMLFVYMSSDIAFALVGKKVVGQ